MIIMKTTIRKLFVLGLLFSLCFSVFASEKIIKIACVGNSITFGAGIANREKNSYPAQLQYYLGEEFEVRNFGVSGTTALSSGDYPYVKTAAFKQSLDYLPDIVLIKLGTNDTKPQNWCHKNNFHNDYQALIDAYQKVASKPRVILLTPVRCFLDNCTGICPQTIEKEIHPLVETLAWENRLEIIDLFRLFGNSWNSVLMPDKLHPSAIGAGMMAQKIGDYLLQKPTEKAKESALGNQATPFNFHGFQGMDFQINGISCKLVRPYIEAEGKPWVLRARFWGHEPQTDVALLEQGFHIAYCDVADLYGSEEAIKRWDDFYKFMKRQGFHRKVVLEGMSRGGLIVYNWAARNPKKVACIYADAPVMDLKSWPMGNGKGAGSKADTKNMLKAYHFKSREEALTWKGNPLDHARALAKAKIPILHVVGDADQVVPVQENTTPFETLMAQYNHPIKVIHKPGVDHHPHSLYNPEPIVRFVLSAFGRTQNACVKAIPGNEYRSGAGWKEGAEWHSVAEEIESSLNNRNLKLLLLGNSITQGWGGNRSLVTYRPGKAMMDKVLGENVWETAGISGDRTQNLLWRIRYGNYNRCHPENVVIAIGVNNLIHGDNGEDTAEGIIAVAQEAVRQFPDSRIFVLGLFPVSREAQNPVRIQYNKTHEILNRHKWKGVTYINPTSWFTDNQGNIREGLYSGDYIHFTAKGYQVAAEKIKELIQSR